MTFFPFVTLFVPFLSIVCFLFLLHQPCKNEQNGITIVQRTEQNMELKKWKRRWKKKKTFLFRNTFWGAKLLAICLEFAATDKKTTKAIKYQERIDMCLVYKTNTTWHFITENNNCKKTEFSIESLFFFMVFQFWKWNRYLLFNTFHERHLFRFFVFVIFFTHLIFG